MTHDAKSLAPVLNPLLADYQLLWQRLRSCHWLVRGPHFFLLHEKFQELYEQAAENADALAERLLARGETPLTTLAAMLDASRIQEGPVPGDARAMVVQVLADLEGITASLRAAAGAAAGDEATVNLLTGMADGQEKEMWMLRAWLEA